MQEFSAISVSSYEAESLAARLTEQSRNGWSVVAIVPTGSTVTAYLSRTARDGAADAMPAQAASVQAAATATAAPMATQIVPSAASDVTSDAGMQPTVTAQAATEFAGAATATGGAPAGWYADPSGRFELRYWDGSLWTEHVSRAGQQFTDPPVA